MKNINQYFPKQKSEKQLRIREILMINISQSNN